MITSPEIVRYVQLERTAQITESRLERLVACARECSEVSTRLVDRLVRAMRPAQQSC